MNLYHVLNRGVDKRTIFMTDRDYLRFIHDMWEFNQKGRVNNVAYSFEAKYKDLRGPYILLGKIEREKQKIVDIHAWVLMKNHYHLLLSERAEGGITEFLTKLNVGYAKYFNEKYKRVGTLFQGRTKKILIERDAHFMHILNYIHFNPLDYLPGARGWRARRVESAPRALAHLEKYRWSSFPDYMGNPNFPSILTTSFFKDANDGNYAEDAKQYLRELDMSALEGVRLE